MLHVIRSQGAGIYKFQLKPCELSYNTSSLLKHPLSKGVAKNRRISIEDPDMRHGRKSRSKKIDGYKRHVLKDLDSGVVGAVALTRANTPKSAATLDRERDLRLQNIHLTELHIDPAYLSSHTKSGLNIPFIL